MADLPDPDFQIKWRDGQYRVTAPNIEEADVYLPDTVRRLLAEARRQALEDAARMCEQVPTALLPNGQFLSERCAIAVRALKDKP